MTFRNRMINHVRNMMIIILFFANISFVNAAGNSKNLNLDFHVVEENVQTSVTKNNKDLEIKYNSEDSKENPYIYLYESKQYNWSSYNVIALQVENKENKPKNINVQMESTSKNKFQLKDEGVVFLENKKTKSYIQGKQTYSNVEIPANFQGTVYITFDNFVNKENNKKIKTSQLENITSWGISIIPTEEGEGNITLNKVVLSRKEDSSVLNQLTKLEILGSKEIQIPMVGESMESYQIKGEDNAQFSLQEDYEGVSISKDGLLNISDSASEGDIIIKININEEIIYEKYISLAHSWAYNQSDEDGVPYGLLSPEESPTVNTMSKFSILENLVTFIKILAVVIFIMVLILYAKWNDKKIKKHRRRD